VAPCLSWSGHPFWIQSVENVEQEAVVVAGIVLIVAGVLLMIYPPLLSIMVAVFLIAA
jgi:uncharacterized membrane protein HdeD (DUF308 family)